MDIPSTSRLLNSYHYSDSLLIQFILSELVRLEEEKETLPHASLLTITPFWLQQSCPLINLIRYSVLLSKTCTSKYAGELARQALKLQTACETEEIQKVERQLHLIKESVKKLLPLFQRDENVLFFLIRKRSSLQALFGPETYQKLIAKLKGSLEETSCFLAERYTKRGFEHLVPIIQEACHDLE